MELYGCSTLETNPAPTLPSPIEKALVRDDQANQHCKLERRMRPPCTSVCASPYLAACRKTEFTERTAQGFPSITIIKAIVAENKKKEIKIRDRC